MNAEMKKEPLFRISKRGAVPWWGSLGIRLLGLLLALILCALIIFGSRSMPPCGTARWVRTAGPGSRSAIR